VPLEGYGLADLRPALRRAVESAAELDVRYDLDVDLDVPLAAAEALSAATGRRCETCGARRVRAAVFTARSSQCGGIMVMVSDERSGFDPARVGPASTGLRISIRTRLPDAGGTRRSFQHRISLPPGLPPNTAP
jgi:hypothetical protein